MAKAKIKNQLSPNDPEVLRVILLVSRRFGQKFKFGYHQRADIEQEASILAIQALPDFDPEAGYPLENFLTTHVRNRLINFKRDKYYRSQPPCVNCPFFRPNQENQCAEFTSRDLCDKYSRWVKRNESKKKLMNSGTSLDKVFPVHTSNHSDNVDSAIYGEMMDKINAELPIYLRADFKRLLEGMSIPKNRKFKVEEAIREILGADHGIE